MASLSVRKLGQGQLRPVGDGADLLQKGQGRLERAGRRVLAVAAAEQIVRRHAVIVAGAAHELQSGLARAVLIVAQQRLADAEIGRHRALAQIPLSAQGRERLGKASVHGMHSFEI